MLPPAALLLFGFILVESAHVIPLDLTCESHHTYSLEIPLNISFGPYLNSQHCSWLFNTSLEYRPKIHFHFIKVELSAQGCHDYISVNGSNRICGSPYDFIGDSNSLIVNFTSDGSNTNLGFKALINRHCIYEYTQPWVIYILPSSYVPKYKDRRELFLDEDVARESAKGYITLGKEAGKPFCPVIRPSSEIPYCDLKYKNVCEWEDPDKDIWEHYNLNLLPHMDTKMEVWTKKKNLQLTKVCLTVEYTGDVKSLSLLASRGQRPTVVPAHYTELVMSKESYGHNVIKIVGIIPEELKIAPIKLGLQYILPANRSANLHRIGGCNPRRDAVYYAGSMDRGQELLEIDNLYPIENASLHCGYCRNGGVQEGEECVCPIGFSGPKCETGCGANAYGAECDVECSLFGDKCRGKIFCRRGFGCDCAAGYHGSECLSHCTPGRYGAGCRQRCGHCANSEPCDIFKGECLAGCEQGFIPPACKTHYDEIIPEIQLENITFIDVMLVAKLKTKINHGAYLMQVKESGGDDWEVWVTDHDPESDWLQAHISSLVPGVDYESRVAYLAEDGETYYGNVKPVNFATKCTENPLKITVHNLTKNSGHVYWEGLSTDEHRCHGENFLFELSSSSKSSWISHKIHGSRMLLEDLLPNTQYYIRIKQHHDHKYYFQNFLTPAKDPTGLVRKLRITNSSSRSVILTWEMERMEDIFRVQYQCKRVLADGRADCSSDGGAVEVSGVSSFEVLGLHPYRMYKFMVNQVPGPKHSEIVTMTKPDVPEVVLMLKGVTTIGKITKVVWSLPDTCLYCNGNLKNYSLVLWNDHGALLMDQNKRLTKTGGDLVVLLEDLKPNMEYQLVIALHNTVGSNPSNDLHINIATDSEGKATGQVELYPPSSQVKEDLVGSETHEPQEIPEIWHRVGDDEEVISGLVAYKTTRHSIGLRWGCDKYKEFLIRLSYRSECCEIVEEVVQEPERCPAWPELFCHTFGNLTADVQHQITMKPVSKGEDIKMKSAKIFANTTEGVPEAPVGLNITDSTDSELFVEWKPPYKFNGHLKLFLIKVDQTDSYIKSNCCVSYPKVEMEVEAERPLYKIDINGLSSGSTFAVTVMGETSYLGPGAQARACTRPPPPPPPPALHCLVPSSFVWTLRHNTTAPLEETISRGSIVLVVPVNTEEAVEDSGIKDPDLKRQLEKSVGPAFYYAGKILMDQDVVLKFGSLEGVDRRETEWAAVVGVPWKSGLSYALVSVSLRQYCALWSLTLDSTALPFTIPLRASF